MLTADIFVQPERPVLTRALGADGGGDHLLTAVASPPIQMTAREFRL
jgi:hypothetical protein